MRVTSVNVTSSRVIAHPTEPKGVLKFSVSLNAELALEDSESYATAVLQGQCERLLDKHQDHLISSHQEKSTPSIPIEPIRALPTTIFGRT